MLLNTSNLVKGVDGNDWIVTKRKKTLNPVKVPLLPEALEIIFKYKNSPRTIIFNRLLPQISNQEANSYLKEIAGQAEKEKKMTFHMARHTLATSVTLSNGIPLETISKLLGHAELKTTQIYAQVVEKKVSEDMILLRQKMDRSANVKFQEEITSAKMEDCYHYKE